MRAKEAFKITGPILSPRQIFCPSYSHELRNSQWLIFKAKYLNFLTSGISIKLFHFTQYSFLGHLKFALLRSTGEGVRAGSRRGRYIFAYFCVPLPLAYW